MTSKAAINSKKLAQDQESPSKVPSICNDGRESLRIKEIWEAEHELDAG
ncbi:MAG: hypothetical protein ACREOO_08645 [bacterium]